MSRHHRGSGRPRLLILSRKLNQQPFRVSRPVAARLMVADVMGMQSLGKRNRASRHKHAIVRHQGQVEAGGY
jgi:hypothetical protein